MGLHHIYLSPLHASNFSQPPLCCACVKGLTAMAWRSGTVLFERQVPGDGEQGG